MSLKINSGATALLGPNGAGKSTMIKTLLGLIQLTSGDGEVLGYNIRTEGDSIRQRIGYMPEYDCLTPEMNAIHQVKYCGELTGMNTNVAMQRAHEVLEYVGLRDQRYREISSFSTGMMQATKLACAIIHDPELLICDEPTNGLDTKARGFMLDTLFQVVKQGNRSILMCSHLMDDVEKICDRIVMIHKGKLIAQGKIEDLKAIDREIEIWVWGGASRMEAALNDAGLTPRRTGRVMRVVRQDETTYDLVLELAAKAKVQIRRMEDYEPSLEDLFLVIMDRLGYGVKSSADLLQSQPPTTSVAPAPSQPGGNF
uniref:ABC transporter related protein (ABC-2.A) n=1 Tax=uncultured marine group II/III euryarchaeote KM3_113_E08 TaxID=1457853 RepID=A0A075G7J2_9EURY|nr:ABC transporter related protein (ABC-2.A) [uncultured marine group II/III euryarchaeote KM3_113_E08]